MIRSAPTRSARRPALLQVLLDIRFLQIVGQIIFVIALAIVISQLVNTASAELRALGLTPNYSFLQNRAGFAISESPAWYTTDSSYGDALRVGINNTLRVISIGLVLATGVGIFFGIFLLSRNWLIRTIARVYVEILRNTPLLVQLFVWYYIVLFSLPQPREALTLPNEGVVFITLRIALYLGAYFLLTRWLRAAPSASPAPVTIRVAFFAALAVIETAFYLHHNAPGWAGTYGAGDLARVGFVVYALVSLGLIAAARWVAPPALRPPAMGATVGQLIGGLLFYFGVMPDAALRTELYPAAFLSIRGIALPEIVFTPRVTAWLIVIVLGAVLAVATWQYSRYLTETTGRPIARWRNALLIVLAALILGWVLAGAAPPPPTVIVDQDGALTAVPLEEALEDELLSLEEQAQVSTQPIMVLLPQQNQLGRIVVGSEISPEYVALLLGLVVYTSAFIAEIVRAGIQAVPRGQLEAARAVGLTQAQTLSLVILPQALRLIIPPLGNQYLNLAKNSSLGIAIGFFETFNTSTTIMNQSGQSITGITLVMVIYLTISLTISLVMNRVNRRFQLVTR